jgi:hypothetical protein
MSLNLLTFKRALAPLAPLAALAPLLSLACEGEGAGQGAGVTAGQGAGQGAGVTAGQGAGQGAGVTAGQGAGVTGGVASCAADNDCPPGTLCDLATASCRVGCARDLDCGPSARCEAGLCEPLTPCAAAGAAGAACAEGSVCGCEGYCVPSTRQPCARDLQCATTDYCDTCEGQCKPRVAPCEPCRDSASCARAGDLCAPVGDAGEARCLRRCEGQATCDNLGPGYLCAPLTLSAGGVSEGAYCVPEAGSCESIAACAADAQCPPDHFCNERQQCQVACAGDTSCPTGQLCQGLRCAPPCAASTDCPAPGAACEEGRCVIPGGCASSRDCPEPETYCDQSALRCVSGCQVDDDCLDASKECVGGRCRPRGCSVNYQCAFGEVCELSTSACVPAPGRHCEPGCDPSASDTSCGSGGQRCLSLQDEEEQPLGDFCFEPCAEEPNACPQGYQCTSLDDGAGGELRLCVRRCDLMSVGGAP